MNKSHFVITIIAFISVALSGSFVLPQSTGYERDSNEAKMERIQLPQPKYNSDTSVEQALYERRSVRAYGSEPLTLIEISQLLWAAQGVTDPKRGFRTSPSAGALYPLEVYVVISHADGIAAGIYKYKPHQHEVIRLKRGDMKKELTTAALGQSCVADSAIAIVFSAVYERTTKKYGNRGVRYVHMEAGHAAQNVYLQAVSLNLGTVVVGAFKDAAVKSILHMSGNEQPLYILPIGKL